LIGGASGINELRDPFHSGEARFYIVRNTVSLLGAGAVQLLAEEMTDELQKALAKGKRHACKKGRAVNQALKAKGVSFGQLTIAPIARAADGASCEVSIDHTFLDGVDPDLVVKPFQWKGSVASLRAFSRNAGHDELGVQAMEILPAGMDGDFDGVPDEVGIGDVTALTVFQAALPRPVTQVELSQAGLIPRLSVKKQLSIVGGLINFQLIGCAECHTVEQKLKSAVFTEPSRNPYYRDTVFPGGQDPLKNFLDPSAPIAIDLIRDIPYNGSLGGLKKDVSGKAAVTLYSDLKRHYLGSEDSESVDEVGTGAGVWLTRPLWGVGSTAPYMHNGQANTLTDAIRLHGGAAAKSRKKFFGLSRGSQDDVITWMNNLVLFKK
jgi:hypothetical protein